MLENKQPISVTLDKQILARLNELAENRNSSAKTQLENILITYYHQVVEV